MGDTRQTTLAQQRQSFRERYFSGRPVAWDSPLPPPEVQTLAAQLPAGRAIDLGCGFGRTAIYLTQLGWQVEGVDFIEEVVAEAQRRAGQAGVVTHLLVGDVTALPFAGGGYSLAIDVGCAHSLPEGAHARYVAEVRRLLAAGGHYLLYTRLAASDNEVEVEAQRPHPLDEALLRALFARDFVLLNRSEGEQSADRAPWRSAWFHWQRVDW